MTYAMDAMSPRPRRDPTSTVSISGGEPEMFERAKRFAEDQETTLGAVYDDAVRRLIRDLGKGKKVPWEISLRGGMRNRVVRLPTTTRDHMIEVCKEHRARTNIFFITALD